MTDDGIDLSERVKKELSSGKPAGPAFEDKHGGLVFKYFSNLSEE